MIDVIVVGAGPAGCYAASLLGEKGFDVHVIEEHPVVGRIACIRSSGVPLWRQAAR